jgi:thiol:disulfide interchange protein
LVQPPLIGLTVFASLGLGMALPMLLLSYSPGLLAVLPRPGAWMNRFKEGAAFLMYATMIWLLWILIQQAGEFGFVLTALSALLVVFAVWLWQAFKPTGLQRVLLLLSVLGAGWAISQIAVLAPTMPRPEQARAGDGGIQSEPYTEALLRAAKAEGPVFVNFTADWCITCKVNEVVAIDTEGTTELFEALGVRYLKADWTLEDPKITAALARFGRVGVPLYLVYHRGSETPLILPQILTGEMIRQALQTRAPAEINDA